MVKQSHNKTTIYQALLTPRGDFAMKEVGMGVGWGGGWEVGGGRNL